MLGRLEGLGQRGSSPGPAPKSSASRSRKGASGARALDTTPSRNRWNSLPKASAENSSGTAELSNARRPGRQGPGGR